MMIIATIEKYLFTEERIRKLILSGVDTLRFNFSYRTIEENIESISQYQQVMDELNSSSKLLIDFPINKVRLGDFELKLFPVNENDDLIFKSGAYSFDCYEYVPVQTSNLGEKVKIGQCITIGDGEVSVQVTEIIDKESIRVKIQNKGVVQYMKTFNIPTKTDPKETLESYCSILKKIKHLNPNYLAISYFGPELFKEMIEAVHKEEMESKIIVKIENELEVDEIEKICKEHNLYGLLLDRGEMGVNMPYYKLGIYQKNIIKIAKKHKKATFISTQILESIMNNYIPSRAEITDLTTSVLDGATGIILCRETAISTRPAYVISVAKKIIAEVEKYKNTLL